MIKKINLILKPEQLFNKAFVKKEIAEKLALPISQIADYKIVRKSIDARKQPKYNISILVKVGEGFINQEKIDFDFNNVERKEVVIIVGAGPAGYFAALQCLINDIKPIILERGKAVEDRKFDIAKINKGEAINPESNFAFGEGGAGTYSDGKLYTRSKKRGNIEKILKLLVFFGADNNILIESHPHVGTDKLTRIITNIRNKIIDCGGEIHFSTKVNEIITNSNAIKGVKTECKKTFEANSVILATGHSARDTYEMLDKNNILLKPKGFAMGVRVEHPQSLIDKIQYKRDKRGKYLPPATYNLVKQIDGRGVYSFCMCPGGIIVPAATDKDQIVVNGMSNSQRNSDYANSGIVVEIKPEDFLKSDNSNLAGINLQKKLENQAFINSGRGISAPAQRLGDFVSGKISSTLPDCSYYPGVVSSPMHFWLPDQIGNRLRKAFKAFDKIMKNYLTNEAVVVGVESRTSSPVQIIRDKTSGEHVQIKGLYPCGEGAGYAGGIVSAAMDGIMVVNSISKKK